MNDRLYRSRDDRIVAGVAGGLAAQFRLDPSLVRILWAILILPTGGLALLLYVLMAFIVPEEPAGDARWAAWDRRPADDPWADQTAPMGTSSPTTAGPTMDSTMASVDPLASSPTSAPTSPATFSPATGPTATTSRPTAPTWPMGATDAGTTGAWPNPDRPVGAPGGLFPPAGPTPAGPMGSGWSRADARDARRAARAERREWRREHRDPTGALLFGLVLILVGGFFLVRAYIPAFDTGQAWPILLVIVGLVLLVGSVRRQTPPSP